MIKYEITNNTTEDIVIGDVVQLSGGGVWSKADVRSLSGALDIRVNVIDDFPDAVRNTSMSLIEFGKRLPRTCPYCDTKQIVTIVSDVPGAPDICPTCGGWL